MRSPLSQLVKQQTGEKLNRSKRKTSGSRDLVEELEVAGGWLLKSQDLEKGDKGKGERPGGRDIEQKLEVDETHLSKSQSTKSPAMGLTNVGENDSG